MARRTIMKFKRERDAISNRKSNDVCQYIGKGEIAPILLDKFSITALSQLYKTYMTSL